MANYGYIPRNGITTLTQLLWAQQEMLGVAPDLAAVLVALAAIAAVDPTTLKVSIGNVDSRTSGLLSLVLGQAPGIFDKGSVPDPFAATNYSTYSPLVSHNEYEVDGSTAYTDSYFVPDGTTNHFNSSKWATAIQIAKDNGGVFGPDWLADSSPDRILFYAANGFAQSIMPYSDENGVPTSPTIAAISSFFGVQDNGDGTYTKVPEKLLPGPDGVWYRRSVPLTGAEQVLIALQAYLAHPVIFGTNSGEPNSFTGSPDQIGSVITGPNPLCLVFTEMQDLIPSYLKPVQNAIVDLSDMLLAPLRLSLGC
ncbi:hypothetical protein HWV62_20832 [Athelia sp. TMB]|nr:hypothetical protein HWV62_20832 [Athelia sp. TMB]